MRQHYGGFRRIYADETGGLHADDTPVFSGANEENTMSYGYEYEYGGFTDMGDEFEMGFYDEIGAGRPAPSGPTARPSRQMTRVPQQRGRAMPSRSNSQGKWQKTVLTGNQVLTAAGNYAITIRPQFDFVAQDFTMDGSLANTTITSILFGDHVIFQNAVGVPMAVVGVAGFIRGLVKGAKIRGGLDITVTGALAGAGTALATFVGLKPQRTCL